MMMVMMKIAIDDGVMMMVIIIMMVMIMIVIMMMVIIIMMVMIVIMVMSMVMMVICVLSSEQESVLHPSPNKTSPLIAILLVFFDNAQLEYYHQRRTINRYTRTTTTSILYAMCP